MILILHLGFCLDAWGSFIYEDLVLTDQGNGFYSLTGRDNESPATAFRWVLVDAFECKLIGGGVGSYINLSSWPRFCKLAMVQVQEGDTVTLESVKSATRKFQLVTIENHSVKSLASNYPITVKAAGEVVYLGFIMDYGSGWCATGAMALNVSRGGVTLMGGATDPNGGNVIAEDWRWHGCPADGGTWQLSLLGATSMTGGIWSATTNFQDANFMRTNCFFRIAVGP